MKESVVLRRFTALLLLALLSVQPVRAGFLIDEEGSQSQERSGPNSGKTPPVRPGFGRVVPSPGDMPYSMLSPQPVYPNGHGGHPNAHGGYPNAYDRYPNAYGSHPNTPGGYPNGQPVYPGSSYPNGHGGGYPTNMPPGGYGYPPAGYPYPSLGYPGQPAKVWQVRLKDGLLSRVLARWCAESGGACVRFVNHASNDVEISAELTLTGDFRSAVKQLMDAVSAHAGKVFQWKLAPNGVLILSDYESR